MRGLTLVALVLSLLSGCVSLDNSARLSVAADGATTAYGIFSGVAKEGNPLMQHPAAMAASLVGRVVLVNNLDGKPEPDRTVALSVFNSITWGVAAHNVGVILAASNPVGVAVGVATSIAIWNSTEMARTHAAVCAVHVDAEACQPAK